MANYHAVIPRFVRHLNSLVPADGTRGDRAALAAMRRNLGKEPGAVPEASAEIDRFLDVNADGEIPPWVRWAERVLYAVSGLFALTVKEPFPERQEDSEAASADGWRDYAGLLLPEGNFGKSMRDLAERLAKEHGDESRQRVDRRFVSLLDADQEQVFDHLRYNLTLLAAHDVKVNWVRLGQDLLRWNDEDRAVQRQWARSYWRAQGEDAEATPAPVGAGASERE